MFEDPAAVAQVPDEIPVSGDFRVEMVKLPEQDSVGLGVARSEFPHLGVEQLVEEQRTTLGAVARRHVRIKPAPLFGFLAGHQSPTESLGVFEDTGLDGFVFSGVGIV